MIPDAAVEAALFKVESVHHIHGQQCLCGFKSHVSRDRTKHIMEATLEAAASHLMAQAWEAGCEEGLSWNPGYYDQAIAQNPYRKARNAD